MKYWNKCNSEKLLDQIMRILSFLRWTICVGTSQFVQYSFVWYKVAKMPDKEEALPSVLGCNRSEGQRIMVGTDHFVTTAFWTTRSAEAGKFSRISKTTYSTRKRSHTLFLDERCLRSRQVGRGTLTRTGSERKDKIKVWICVRVNVKEPNWQTIKCKAKLKTTKAEKMARVIWWLSRLRESGFT